MRKTLIIFMALILSIGGYAQQWNAVNSAIPSAPKTKLVASSDEQIVVNFQLGGFYTNAVKTPNGKQFIIGVPEMSSMLEKGTPDLPWIAIPAIIGDMAEMNVKVIDAQYTDFSDIEIAPSKGNFSRQIDPATVPYTYGEMYQKNEFYPATQATLEAPYILRDFRGQNIMVMPFAYNAMSKTLRVYHNLTIEMNKVSDNGENPKVSKRSDVIKMDVEQKSSYKRRFINFEENAAKYTFIEDAGDMLIICADQFMEGMNAFVEWKNISGRPTTMVGTSTTGSSAAQVKAYVQNAYAENPNLQFLLLVGDYAHITPQSMNGGCSDIFFGQLEGNDYYPEVLVGRFSVESDADVATMVNRTIHYERDIQTTDTWLNKGIGIAANEGAGSGHMGGEADYVHMNYIRDTLLHYTYETVSQQYSGVGSGTSATAISTDFNNGVSIGNYTNHGSVTSWAVGNFSVSHVNALTNDNQLPYIWSVACDNGRFNNSTPCFGESWLRATNNTTGAPTGAMGGMFSWISQPWQPPMTGQDEMVAILTEWIDDSYCHTFGGASLNGNMKILDAHPSDNGSTHNTWILFGDPSFMVRTDIPAVMNVTHVPAILVGMSSLNINVDANFALATLSIDNEVIASTTVIGGQATLNFAPISTVGTAKLIVMGYNKVTYQSDIDLIPAEGAYLTMVDYTPTTLPYAESTNISIAIKNVGSDPTNTNSTITLTTAESIVTIENGEATYGNINAGDSIFIENAFRVAIPAEVANNQPINFTVNIACGNDTWSTPFIVNAVKPVMTFANASWPGSYTPGETVTVYARFENKGGYKAVNAICEATCESEYVTIEEATYNIGTIEAGGFATAIYNITIDENCPSTTVLPVNFALNCDNDITAEGTLSMKNACNVVFTLDDSYGDGWNGNFLTVSFNDGTPSRNITIENGFQHIETIEITSGTHVTVNFTTGSYTSECSFSIKYEDGETIYQSSGTPTNGVACEFDCACGGTTVVLNPVQNLEATIDGETVILTWEAPRNATSYTIFKNGLELATVTELTYTDDQFTEGNINYCVYANYEEGQSGPACVMVSITSVDDNANHIKVYPNPASTVLNINVAGNSNNLEYVIYNQQGQVMTQKALGSFEGTEQINLDNFAKGIYFLHIKSDAQVKTQKVVVE